MRHPTDGVLRRLIDEPAGVSDPDRRHVADCAVCLTDLAAVREDAELVEQLERIQQGTGDLGADPGARVDVSAAGSPSSRKIASSGVR